MVLRVVLNIIREQGEYVIEGRHLYLYGQNKGKAVHLQLGAVKSRSTWRDQLLRKEVQGVH